MSPGRRRDNLELTLGLLSRRAPTMESDLRAALRGGQLRLHYQGQFDLRTGRLVALEALIRWAHPRDGLLPPGQFFPMAHDAGLMGAIDRWALRAACADGAWLAGRGHAVEIAVNVSAVQLANRDFVARVEEVAERAGCPTELLTLELGQKDVLVDLEAAASVGVQLGLRGIRTSVSEVGSPSAVAHDLHILHVDEIKIDRTLTAGIEDPGSGAAETIARLTTAARRLRARVVLEGVETDAQYRLAQTLGLDRAQGYLLGRPAPLEDLAHLLVRAPWGQPARGAARGAAAAV